MRSDSELLRQYAEADSEEAFAELVRRHLDLVYSAALRQVNGDAHLAQDVAQRVFSDLARKAATLSRHRVLTGWLYTSTHFAATKAVRAESRRRAQEQKAHAMHELLQDRSSEPDWEKLGPVLDQVMHQLNDFDRETILLRFFENRRLAEVGERLGLSEDAARKRVERALEKLRAFLVKRGLTTTTALAAAISAHAIQTSPAGLAATLATRALAGATLTTATVATATFTETIAMTTIQKSLIVVAFAATVGTAYYQAHQASRLRDEVQTLQQQQASLEEQVERVNSDNASLSNRFARESRSPALSTERLRELLRLRGEVGVLRRNQRELEQTLAAARSKATQDAAQSASTVAQQAGASAPFQVMLVTDELGENTEDMTYNASAGTGETLHLDKTPLLDYTAIRSATVTKNDSSGTPEISVELSPEGKDLFAAITREHVNKRLAIVLSGQLYAAPVIRSEISDGKAQITGNFSEEEAQELAAKINQAIRDP